jgi:hypothetical protein
MQPTLAWLDFNAADRDRTQRVLALFEEREARDELGLGGIRDSFADHLFPGTSTIQTRLRYLFFIPWIYQELERRRTPSREVAERARKMELNHTEPLRKAHGANAGVFGRVAKEKLKRLPSDVFLSVLSPTAVRASGISPTVAVPLHRTLSRLAQALASIDASRIPRREQQLADDLSVEFRSGGVRAY